MKSWSFVIFSALFVAYTIIVAVFSTTNISTYVDKDDGLVLFLFLYLIGNSIYYYLVMRRLGFLFLGLAMSILSFSAQIGAYRLVSFLVKGDAYSLYSNVLYDYLASAIISVTVCGALFYRRMRSHH